MPDNDPPFQVSFTVDRNNRPLLLPTIVNTLKATRPDGWYHVRRLRIHFEAIRQAQIEIGHEYAKLSWREFNRPPENVLQFLRDIHELMAFVDWTSETLVVQHDWKMQEVGSIIDIERLPS